MKRLSLGVALVLLAACDRGITAPNPGAELSPSLAASSTALTAGNKLQCFSGTEDGGYNGTCELLSGGSAYLNTVDDDDDPNNNYAGVYVYSTNLDGKLLSSVNKLSFTYEGTSATGGSPRFSIPIDTDGDGSWDAFAFIDALGCTDGDATSGTVDVINDETCLIWFEGVSYENWDAFVEANPTYRIATDAVSFIIVDQPGEFTISNVQLGRGSAKTK